MPADFWDDYHRAGWIAGAPLESPHGYGGELLALWRTFFMRVPPGSRVVDIGTGNGAIALIARDVAVSRKVTFDIHGIDRAAIDPPGCVPGGAARFEGIRFHAHTSAEALPFDDASVQAVSGQFALEYCDVPATLQELARVMEPGGQALFILHRTDSALTSHARESLRHAEVIFRDTRIFERLRRFLETERLEPRRAPALLRQLNRAGNELREAIAASPHPQLLEGVAAALRQLFAARGRTGTAELLKSVDRTERSVRTTLAVLEQLLGVARTEEQMNSMLALASDAFRAELDSQTHGEIGIVGWRVSLSRRTS